MEEWPGGAREFEVTLILCDPVMVATCRAFVKALELHNTQSEPECQVWNLVNTNYSYYNTLTVINVPTNAKFY